MKQELSERNLANLFSLLVIGRERKQSSLDSLFYITNSTYNFQLNKSSLRQCTNK